MDEFTTQDLIAELQDYYNEEREPGGVTPAEWAEAQEISVVTARAQLSELIDKRVLIRKKQRVSGTRVFVYYKSDS